MAYIITLIILTQKSIDGKQNLLKITKLDVGSIVIEKDRENVADMMRDIELQFAYRARQEQKEIIYALDHTQEGDMVRIDSLFLQNCRLSVM